MNLDQFKTVEDLAAAIKTLDMVTAVAWTDYSAISTIVGWSATTTEEIWYKKIGKLMFVQFHISGTSDAGDASFTLPFSQQGDVNLYQIIRVKNNGTVQVGFGSLTAASDTYNGFQDIIGNAFTSSGDKYILGQFFYET